MDISSDPHGLPIAPPLEEQPAGPAIDVVVTLRDGDVYRLAMSTDEPARTFLTVALGDLSLRFEGWAEEQTPAIDRLIRALETARDLAPGVGDSAR